ncbi:hypothetical protein ARMGADRAFT_81030 [Armillaria gallica]|uniref:Uncharacterized protein n=1 Tax=Armillaria gallica TaxID=47427 RepID=A0A2H3CW12_ARMGA|nr:hypothetical protein ARMGADRAFT_81030 [Armillaria gallica]
MLRDSQSFGDVNPTIFGHWIVCTIQLHIYGCKGLSWSRSIKSRDRTRQSLD